MKHLVTPRLLMRPFSLADLTDLHTLYSDGQAMKYCTDRMPGALEDTRIALEEMMSDFAETGYGMFAVIERKEKRFIGQCGLQRVPNSDFIRLEYTFMPGSWGKGYATEASMEVLRAALGDWGIEKVIAKAFGEDRASTRVLEKIGMVCSSHEKHNNREILHYSIGTPKKTADSIFQSTYERRTNLSMSWL